MGGIHTFSIYPIYLFILSFFLTSLAFFTCDIYSRCLDLKHQNEKSRCWSEEYAGKDMLVTMLTRFYDKLDDSLPSSSSFSHYSSSMAVIREKSQQRMTAFSCSHTLTLGDPKSCLVYITGGQGQKQKKQNQKTCPEQSKKQDLGDEGNKHETTRAGEKLTFLYCPGKLALMWCGAFDAWKADWTSPGVVRGGDGR